MVCKRIVVSLLVAIAVSVQCVMAQAPANCTQAQATAKQTFCKDCKSSVKCTTAFSPPVPLSTCVTGKACSVVSIGETSTMAACVTLSTTPCKCSTPKICDAYNPLKSWACINGALYPSTNCTQACSAGVCTTTLATTPTTTAITTPSPITGNCTASDAGQFIYMNQACTSGGFCIEAGAPVATINCTTGQYVDISSGNCVIAPPQPCAGKCVGACPDKTNCSKWFICNSVEPVLISQEQCSSPNVFFDPINGTCTAVNTTCPAEAICNFGTTTAPTISPNSSTNTTGTTISSNSTTNITGTTISSNSTTNTTGTTPTSNSTVTASTSKPSSCTAANVGKSYPYPGDCKKYYGCRLIAPNIYGYVVSTCSGSLVFNPTTSYCDLPANVPSCTTAG